MPLTFDLCPACGAEPTFGIRCHPKWSVKVGTLVEGELDLLAFYSHDDVGARVLRDAFANDGVSDVIAVEEWTGERWEERNLS